MNADEVVSKAPEISALHLAPGGGPDYASTFKGLQDYGPSGMTRLEEMVDAAFQASDHANAAGARTPCGAALFTTGRATR